MSIFETVVGLASRRSILSMVYPVLGILLLIPLTGCADESAEGPVNSSLAASTNATAEFDSDQAPHSDGADSDGEEDPKITMNSTSTGVTARVAWDRPSDFNVAGYTIYYGKRSSKESSSEESEPNVCFAGESQDVNAPPATIAGLEPNTQYFFAIRAHNEKESLCSNQIMAVTPPVES